jgi:hypothetical protein
MQQSRGKEGHKSSSKQEPPSHHRTKPPPHILCLSFPFKYPFDQHSRKALLDTHISLSTSPQVSDNLGNAGGREPTTPSSARQGTIPSKNRAE